MHSFQGLIAHAEMCKVGMHKNWLHVLTTVLVVRKQACLQNQLTSQRRRDLKRYADAACSSELSEQGLAKQQAAMQ